MNMALSVMREMDTTQFRCSENISCRRSTAFIKLYYYYFIIIISSIIINNNKQQQTSLVSSLGTRAQRRSKPESLSTIS